MTGWDLNPRAQLINTPNTDIIYLLSKGTDMEREELLKSYPLHFPNQSLCSAKSLLSISLFSSSVSSFITIMISRLLPWSIQSTIPQKKPYNKKIVESSQRMIGEQNHNLTVKKHFELQFNAPRDAK